MYRLALVLGSLLWLAGCATTPDEAPASTAGTAPVKSSQPTMAEKPRPAPAQPTSMASTMPAAAKMHPLDDPSSPLAQRTFYFDFDQSTIRSEFRDGIVAHGSYLADHPTAAVTLAGHADERGSRPYNMALGERRANAVRDLMLISGAASSQIAVISYGEERPADPGHNEAAWAKNRRVELSYTSR